MSAIPCSKCRKRVRGKLNAGYWAWFLADNTRVAFRQRLCDECLADTFVQPIKDAEANETACPLCHVGSADDLDACYGTVYLPGCEPREVFFPTDAVCAVSLRSSMQLGAERLPERQAVVGGSGTPQTATRGWDAYGLQP